MEQEADHAYRIIPTPTGWEVTAFNRSVVAGPTISYTDEALPEWLRKYISVLKLVDHTGSIPGVGHRVGVVFWITRATGAIVRSDHD